MSQLQRGQHRTKPDQENDGERERELKLVTPKAGRHVTCLQEPAQKADILTDTVKSLN